MTIFFNRYTPETSSTNPSSTDHSKIDPDPARFPKNFFNGKLLAYGILVLWAALAAALMAMPAYVPDEAWFLHEALRSAKAIKENGSWAKEFFFHHNAFGYGGIWWTLYTAIVLAWDWLSDFLNLASTNNLLAIDSGIAKVTLWEHIAAAAASPMMMMRMVSLASLAAMGIVLIRSARNGVCAFVTIFALVTMPLAWWSGKMAAPEMLSASLIATAAVLWFTSKKIKWSTVLAGIAVGIKPTIAPVFLALMTTILVQTSNQNKLDWRAVKLPLALTIGAILACNAWIFYDLRSGIDQYLYLSRAYAPNPDRKLQSDLILWMHSEFWEGSNYGSLSYWAGGFGIIFIAVLAAFFTNIALAVFLVFGGLLQYAFMLTQPPHGWYWFPFILCTIVPFSMLKKSTAFLTLIALTIILPPLKYTKHEIWYRKAHLQELDQVASQQDCIDKELSRANPEIVYDMAAMGTTVSSRRHHNWTLLNYHDSYVSLIIAPDSIPRDKNKVLLIGSRSYFNHAILRSYAEIPGRLIGECGSIKLINIENKT